MKITKVGNNDKAVLISLLVEENDKITINNVKLNVGEHLFNCFDEQNKVISNMDDLKQNQKDRKNGGYRDIPKIEPVYELVEITDFTDYFKDKENFEDAAKLYLIEKHNIKFEKI